MKTSGAAGWKSAAARMAAHVPRESLHPAVVEWAGTRPRSERWGVALSGGSDSVGLLLLLWAHWHERRARLTAFHFNHRLRGAESEADARFCKRLCAALRVPLVSGRWEAGRRMASEAEARLARFDFIGRGMSARRSGVIHSTCT